MSRIEPGDYYTDAHGKVWVVTGVCGQPSVVLECVDVRVPDETTTGRPRIQTAIGCRNFEEHFTRLEPRAATGP
jgi:hypothetical protein